MNEELARFLDHQNLRLRMLGENHDIEFFTCGKDEAMDYWLSNRARKWHDEGLSRVWILSNGESPDTPVGFFALSNHQVIPQLIPRLLRSEAKENREWVNKLESAFPATLLGKFALDEESQGRELGKILMLCVYVQHVIASGVVASKFLVLDVRNDRLSHYYASNFNFIRAQPVGEGTRMLKSTSTIIAEVRSALGLA